ncbi:MAG: hypothetical protein NY202_04875 [Mollicutes bacterium UO1]
MESKILGKNIKKRGRPLKITSYNLPLLKSFIKSRNKKDNDTRTQQEMTERYHFYRLSVNLKIADWQFARQNYCGLCGLTKAAFWFFSDPECGRSKLQDGKENWLVD